MPYQLSFQMEWLQVTLDLLLRVQCIHMLISFKKNGVSMIMLAKDNRSKHLKEACKKHGGFCLGTIKGIATKVALDCIKK